MEPRIEGQATQKPDTHVLGERARWGGVAYTGAAFAPSERTYGGINPRTLNYTHRADSGIFPGAFTGAHLANLVPLVLASMWEAAFAREAGALSTWSN
ncbi:MAG: hypothetical protein ACYDCC_03270 [Actinomycetota bacterium]